MIYEEVPGSAAKKIDIYSLRNEYEILVKTKSGKFVDILKCSFSDLIDLDIYYYKELGIPCSVNMFLDYKEDRHLSNYNYRSLFDYNPTETDVINSVISIMKNSTALFIEIYTLCNFIETSNISINYL